VAFYFLKCRAPQHHSLVQQDIITYLRGLPDYHAGTVVDEEPPAYRGSWVYLYPGAEPAEMRCQPRQKPQLMPP
jgi:hypothetical protein